jgi:hypothetical protein
VDPLFRLILPEFAQFASIRRPIGASRAGKARIGDSDSTHFPREPEVKSRYSRLATSGLVIAAILLMPGLVGAVYYALGPSKDEWGLKYAVEVTAADNGKLNVDFTLASQGRLTPIYSATVIAFSNPGPDGGRSYLEKAQIDLKPTKDGPLAGQTQIRQEIADRAMIRILTLNVDGRQYKSAHYYDIPLKKFLLKSSAAASPGARAPIASPPGSKTTR